MRGYRRIRSSVSFCILLFITVMLLMVRTDHGSDTHKTLTIRMMGPLKYDNPHLLKLVSRSINPPSTQPYFLVADQHSNYANQKYLHYKTEFAYKFCQKIIRQLFEGVRDGFFVEAGALDGEFLSNTLPLEINAGWTGLLVEADGNMFKQLLHKRRKAWASHSCLAIYPYPHIETLVNFELHSKLTDEYEKHSARAHGALMTVSRSGTLDNSSPGHEVYEAVQCLPLATLLLALNITHVDLISLDVEGAEVGVLRHFPFNKLTVDVWLVEHVQTQQQQQQMQKKSNSSLNKRVDEDFINMFINHGYELYKVSDELLISNYVFILRGSEHYKRLKGQKNRIKSN